LNICRVRVREGRWFRSNQIPKNSDKKDEWVLSGKTEHVRLRDVPRKLVVSTLAPHKGMA
jgi:hypothetical protein